MQTAVTRAGLLGAALTRPIDVAWLAAFRAVFGSLLAISMLRFVLYGWVERFFIAPRFHFKYWGFAWVEPLPGRWMQWLFVGLAVLAFAVAIGCAFRLSALLFAVGLSYVQLIDVTTYLNHYYLAALLAWLLALTPASRIWSIDAWLRSKRHKAQPAAQVPAGVLYLFRCQIALVYTFAGLAKLQSDWLVHAQPLRIWLGQNTHLPLVGPSFTASWVPLALSWAGFLFDATIACWLLLPRTRPFAYIVLIVFHLLTRVLFPIGMFPAIMIAAALVFFSPSWPRSLSRAWPRSYGRQPSELPIAPPASAVPESAAALGVATRARLPIALGIGYCIIQLALPLRHLYYGGNVLWHEQGMRFSWRVMVRAKGGDTTFIVRDPSRGHTFHISPRTYLTDTQESEMSSQPDLILQLAHHIQKDLSQRGLSSHAANVYVDSRVSLNGRRSRPLVDPTVDLAKVHDGLAPASWVLPAPEQSPPHTRPVL